jgi:exodeoxyribonuclease V gamma subunit
VLRVYQGNRLESLAERFARVVGRPAGDPFVPEVVVTQNAGMARWLSMRTAQHLGVCANLAFRLPEELVWEAFRTFLGDVPEAPVPDATVLAWQLMDQLAQLSDDARFTAVRFYLSRGGDVARYELARRLAVAFGQYALHRPQWVLAWERGQTAPISGAAEDEAWQAEIWRRTFADGAIRHRARLAAELATALLDPRGVARRKAWHERISLFGIPALPPSTLAVFEGLATRCDVHLFLLNPCREYWTDIRSRRESARASGEREPNELHFDEGNPLLASLGGQGRELIALLQEVSDESVATDDVFVEPDGGTLLHHLQADILELRDRGTAGVPRLRLAANDRSLRFHACHGAMREVEVLHDQLLDLFDEHPDLEPGDVVVMTPEIESYAPAIEAVFGTAPAERHIPFTIADRSLRAESPLVAAFVALLELPRTRYDANRLLDILVVPAVGRRFDLEPEDIEQVRRWVRESGIRWGIDAASRAELGLPATDEHTWRFGLDRLMVGYGLPADGTTLFRGILPYDDVEGGAARVLGKAHAFATAVFALRDDLAGERAPSAWSAALARVLDRFIRPTDDEEPDASAIRAALVELERSAAHADFATSVSLDVVKHFLARRLEAPSGGGSFLAGRVTFCAMVPMRSIPFEVVCMIGMNDGSFPRNQAPLGFDLIARSPRRLGDRSRRDDDRYLFLEALLSARRCLLLSWTGFDPRDNSVRPPSVLVSELLDAAERGFAPADGRGSLRKRLLTPQRLQAFSGRYFGAERAPDEPLLFSYSRELCAASACAAPQTGPSAAAFLARPLAAPPAPSEVELDELVRFFESPARSLLRDRLGVRLRSAEAEVEDREPFAIEALGGYSLDQEILALQLSGYGWDEIRAKLSAQGLLPHGRFADAELRHRSSNVARFVERLQELGAPRTSPPLRVSLEVGDIRLVGALPRLSEDGLLAYRFARTRGKDELGVWIRHLVLAASEPPGVAVCSRWLTSDTALRFERVTAPDERLAELIDLYRAGQREPLPIFSGASKVFAEEAQKGSPEAALAKANSVFRDTFSDGKDGYVALAFRGVDPLGPRFRDLAMRVFGALLGEAVREEI